MGMLDSVRGICPSCGSYHEFQSKGGPCEMSVHDLDDAPPDVMSDVNRHCPVFCDCGEWLSVDIERRVVVACPPPEPEGPLSIRLEDGKVLDFKRLASEGGGQFVFYNGNKHCGEFDKEYISEVNNG